MPTPSLEPGRPEPGLRLLRLRVRTTPLALFYAAANGQPQYIDEGFRTIVANPCR